MGGKKSKQAKSPKGADARASSTVTASPSVPNGTEPLQQPQPQQQQPQPQRRDSTPQAFAQDMAQALNVSESTEIDTLFKSSFGHCVTEEQFNVLRHEWRLARRQWKYEAFVSRNLVFLLRRYIRSQLSLQAKIAPLVASYLECPPMESVAGRSSVLRASGRIQNAVLHAKISELLGIEGDQRGAAADGTGKGEGLNLGALVLSDSSDEEVAESPLGDEDLADRSAPLTPLTPSGMDSTGAASSLASSALSSARGPGRRRRDDDLVANSDDSFTDDQEDVEVEVVQGGAADSSAGDDKGYSREPSALSSGLSQTDESDTSPPSSPAKQVVKRPATKEAAESTAKKSDAAEKAAAALAAADAALASASRAPEESAKAKTRSASPRKKPRPAEPSGRASPAVSTGKQAVRKTVKGSSRNTTPKESPRSQNSSTKDDGSGGVAPPSRALVKARLARSQSMSASVSASVTKGLRRARSDSIDSGDSESTGSKRVVRHRSGSLVATTAPASDESEAAREAAGKRVMERRKSLGSLNTGEVERLNAVAQHEERKRKRQEVIEEQRRRLARVTERRKRKEARQKELEELMKALLEMPCLYTSEVSGNRQVADHTRKIRWLFESKKITYRVVDVSLDQEEREYMTTTSGLTSLPQVFVTDRYRGGWGEIETANERGDAELAALLKPDAHEDGSSLASGRTAASLLAGGPLASSATNWSKGLRSA